jgi:hypothetical protein
MTFLTSKQARDMIPDYTQHDICVFLRRGGHSPVNENNEKTLWLNYLCAKGDIVRVKEFLAMTNYDELKHILNTKLFEQFDGTVLHTTLYWNSGNQAIDLYELLVEHGADPCLDYYYEMPWHNRSTRWIVPFGTYIGERFNDEFEETYQFLREAYESNSKPSAARRLDFGFSDDDEIEQEHSTSPIRDALSRLRLSYDSEEETDYEDMPALISDSDTDF